MATKIDKLLNKKGWTGAEVGKLLVASLVYDIENRGKDKEPLFKEEDFRKMESSLANNPAQQKVYNCYSSLYSSLVDMTNISQGQFQQFFHGYYRCFGQLSAALSEQQALLELMKKPVVVTEEQYNRLKEQARKRLRATETYYTLIIRDIIWYFLAHPEKAPKDIAAALEACKNEKVTNQRMLDNYMIDTDQGYWLYEDGTRSDVEGRPTQREGYVKPESFALLKAMFLGTAELMRLYKERTGKDIDRMAAGHILSYMQAVMDGVEEDDLPELTEAESLAMNAVTTGTELNGKWHFYDAPTDLDKYTAIDDNIDRYFGQYSISYDAKADDDVEEISEEDQFKEFKADYPQLYKATHEYLASVFPKAAKLTGAKQFSTSFTWGELAAAGIDTFVKAVDPDREDIIDEYSEEPYSTDNLVKRAEKYGFAVIADPNEESIDDNGNYIEPKVSSWFDEYILKADLDPGEKSEIGYYRRVVNTVVIPSICFIYAYDALLDILIRVYGVPEIKAIKEMLCVEEIAEKIDALNALIYMLYNGVNGSKEEKAKARKDIMERFFAIDVEKCKPSQEAIEDTEEQLTMMFKRRELFDYTFRFLPFINKLKARGYEDEV